MSAAPVKLVFADDSQVAQPNREGVGPLMAMGGLVIEAESVRIVERQIEAICESYEFPPGAKFKWSPGKELWMRNQLRGRDRQRFFLEVFQVVTNADAQFFVVIEDEDHRPANSGLTNEQDLVVLFLERVNNRLKDSGSIGLVVCDRPSGGPADQAEFLSRCAETLEQGTRWVKPDRIVLNVLTTPSHLSRLLQVADLVVSCTTAFVGGEATYSPPIFDVIRSRLASADGRIGGVGLKIHPDFVYANLYHWLLGDEDFLRFQTGHPMPLKGRPYAMSADQYRA